MNDTPPAGQGGGQNSQWLHGLQKKLGMEPTRPPTGPQHEPIKEIYFTGEPPAALVFQWAPPGRE